MIKQFIKEENEKEPQLQQSINEQNSSIEVAREKKKRKPQMSLNLFHN